MVMGKCKEQVLRAALEGDDMMEVALAVSSMGAPSPGDKSKSLGLERVNLEGSIRNGVAKLMEKQATCDKQ